MCYLRLLPWAYRYQDGASLALADERGSPVEGGRYCPPRMERLCCLRRHVFGVKL